MYLVYNFLVYMYLLHFRLNYFFEKLALNLLIALSKCKRYVNMNDNKSDFYTFC